MLFYQLVVVSFIGVEKIDLGLCERIFTKLNGNYSKVRGFLEKFC